MKSTEKTGSQPKWHIERPSSLADIELEGLETPTDSGAARALPSRALFGHENFDTSRTEATDAFRAGVRVS